MAQTLLCQVGADHLLKLRQGKACKIGGELLGSNLKKKGRHRAGHGSQALY
jgi:hypothetical protein